MCIKRLILLCNGFVKSVNVKSLNVTATLRLNAYKFTHGTETISRHLNSTING